MRIERLRLQHFRCITQVDIVPGSFLNWLVGPNGAGKTTVLECIYLLSYGHSFRSGPIETLIQRGQHTFSLYAEVVGNTGRHAVGMSRSPDGWRLRLDGVDQQQITPILERCAALCFDPGSHALIVGVSEVRRRFLDWGVFHVEHAFLNYWRRFRRALRQRNILLRNRGESEHLAIWETELQNVCVPIEEIRSAHIKRFEAHLKPIAESLLSELGPLRLVYSSGWNLDKPLLETLREQRNKDRELGYTRAGPHRADWRISFEKAPTREYLSRGQTKLTALACLLAQACVFFDCQGEWPILCLDDLTSELDATHLNLVMEYVSSVAAQIWVTSTQAWNGMNIGREETLFHVEQTSICRA